MATTIFSPKKSLTVAAAIFVLFTAFAGIVAQSKKDTHIRVMTFNIRYDEPRDGVNAWPNRKTKVADVIRFHKADLIGVQEALLGSYAIWKRCFPILRGSVLGERTAKKAVNTRRFCIGNRGFRFSKQIHSGSRHRRPSAARAGTRCFLGS